MPYRYEFTNKLDQLGMIQYTLILEDTDNILPSHSIPVLLKPSEATPENLKKIALDIINIETPNHEIN